jgi:DnaJ homolog subfamily B member 4
MASNDYYETLGVGRDASEKDIKKAYKKQAIKFHPDRAPEDQREAMTKKFKALGEAYSALSDPEKRKVYDRFGKAGMDGSRADGGGSGVPPGFTGAGSGGAGPQFRFHSRGNGANFDENEIFRQAFGGRGLDDIFSMFGGGGSFSQSQSSSSMGGPPLGSFGGGGGRPLRKAKDMIVRVPCTLEQLYNGCTRHLRVKRHIVDEHSGQSVPVSKDFDVGVKPGYKDGVKITFRGQGNEVRGAEPGDLRFVIEEQPHPAFGRDRNDLHYTAKISLRQALCGFALNVPMLEGSSKRIEVRDIVRPDSTKRIAGCGMPVPTREHQFGDLIIHFDIAFPHSLSAEQRRAIGEHLPRN